MNVVGGGAHCADIEAIANRLNIHNLTIYDDNPETGIPTPPPNLRGPLVIGVNDPTARRMIAERFPNARGAAPLLDPSAIIGPEVQFGHGVVVAPMVSILHSVTLKDHVHVNTGAQMVRTIVGAFTTISPGVVICGNVEIGEESWIGAGAVVADRVKIGNGVIVAAGAIIPPESVVPDNSKVIGVFKG